MFALRGRLEETSMSNRDLQGTRVRYLDLISDTVGTCGDRGGRSSSYVETFGRSLRDAEPCGPARMLILMPVVIVSSQHFRCSSH